ncbi:GntR family transcriptional regulator [Alcaligenes endophyticus]|uniref:GntR family transcriptional regulator n=1 Tax=Alcaligenes endophyticus TaxID=1929088 RepID=A0ABT8EIG5_9BURK|nr:GntR family transcriptional regulator [Alcaligenes endophyticus]MCX5592660.1 GntR family transcriptional regulator [Alcaligenes endophyticus]MDN4120992.1 GntR family transcriptional regulator [Alcaligenes endophyticus]
MMNKQTASVLLADQAFECIRHLLRTDGLRSGQFVSISALVEQTGFPLAPMREAVQKAAALGLVSIVPKRGVLVLEANPTHAKECLGIRCLFDQEGARRLAARPNQGLLHGLIQQHQAIIDESLIVDVNSDLQWRATGLDWQMHELLVSGMKNPEAQAIYTLNRDKLTIMYNTRPIHPDRLVPAFKEHIEILTAISEGQAQRAVDALEYHYRQIYRWWGINPDTDL